MNKFLIEHIDPLGQGVFKEEGQIYFIPKTLPGESGEFKVVKSSKGVNFATCTKLDEKSSERIESKCRFFKDCNGCHYLHTSYENEIKLKTLSYEKILSYLGEGLPNIKIIKNSERFEYRNRIQLHYSLKQNQLGFKRKGSKEILPISQCLIASPSIQKEITKLFTNGQWRKLLPKKSRPSGHVEIYDDGIQTHVYWNQKYAGHGFSQVNQQVNTLLQDEIGHIFSDSDIKVLDLFGGDGNLVKNLKAKRHLSIDIYPLDKVSKDKLSLDLFDENALQSYKTSVTDNFDTVFIDPPRSGFKNLQMWIDYISPKQILYVSCHPSTMTRDLKAILTDYEIESIYMIEFFPGTYHFEGAILLNKKLN